MMINRHSVPLLLAASFLCCNTPDPQPSASLTSSTASPVIVAIVGTDSIDVTQFESYSASLPAALRTGQTPDTANRQVLETLIDKTLLLTEAVAIRLEGDPEFIDKLEEFRQARILESYRRQNISSRIKITHEEMEQLWRSNHLDRALRFGGVMVETMTEALEVKALLEAGAELGELAETRSLHEPSAGQGGQLTQYLAKSQVVPPIAQAIFHLEVGGVSEPVPVQGEGNGPQNLAVFKVLDEIVAPLEISEATIRQELATKKMTIRARILRDSLIAAYDARIHKDAIQFVAHRAAEMQSGSVTVAAADSAQAMVTYRNGQVTIGEFLDAAESLHAAANTLLDAATVATLLKDNILPAHLSLEEASVQGMEQNPALLKTLARKREELLLSLLRYRQVDQHVTATEREIRTYFEDNPVLFRRPDVTEIVEILVSSQQLAQQVKDEIEAGADAQALAKQHTLREDLRTTGGVVDINKVQLANYKDIFVSAQRSPIGSVQGPVATHDGFFAVFKILRRTYLQPSFEEAQVRATAFVRIRKAKIGYVQYVRSLREKYPVQIFDEQLAGVGQGS